MTNQSKKFWKFQACKKNQLKFKSKYGEFWSRKNLFQNVFLICQICKIYNQFFDSRKNSPIPSANKRYLQNTLVATLQNNKRIEKKINQNADDTESFSSSSSASRKRTLNVEKKKTEKRPVSNERKKHEDKPRSDKQRKY